MEYILEQITTFIQWSGITPKEIVDSLIIYAVVRGFYWGIKHTQTESSKIIRAHARNGHTSPLQACKEDKCRILTPGRQDLDQPVVTVLPSEY